MEIDEDDMMEHFLAGLTSASNDDELLDFCRKHSLHGTPKVFDGAENQYYEFRKRISDKFKVNFHEVFITGSAKLGFSPFKNKLFDYDSDIDVAIVSSDLYERIMATIHDYQMQLRDNRKTVSYYELSRYHKFLEYGAIGWMRPDLLPTSFLMKELRTDWFDFFESLSYGKSEVGNYKVTAGVFKTYNHLEKYTVSGLRSLKTKIEIGAVNVAAN